MHFQEFDGINSFLSGMSQVLLKHAVRRDVRGYVAYELPNPIIIKIANPLSRIITIEKRNWNYVLPYAESLWLASGRNDIEMIGYYLKRMYDFSDDAKTIRAGYGPRLRFFTGISNDYNINFQKSNEVKEQTPIEIDQFEYIEKSFQRDPFTRQAIISITDPAKDYFSINKQLKSTKDFPCTNNIQFTRNGDKLDVIVNMRSNDFIWGASGVNIFNFTFIQEYFSKILGLEIGAYYHIVTNFHYYDRFKDKIEELAYSSSDDDSFSYDKSFTNLKQFDEKIKALEQYEIDLRVNKVDYIPNFEDDFFNDWAKVFYSYHYWKNSVEFCNPLLNLVAKRKKVKKLAKLV